MASILHPQQLRLAPTADIAALTGFGVKPKQAGVNIDTAKYSTNGSMVAVQISVYERR